jgi:hypothetical protein
LVGFFFRVFDFLPENMFPGALKIPRTHHGCKNIFRHPLAWVHFSEIYSANSLNAPSAVPMLPLPS